MALFQRLTPTYDAYSKKIKNLESNILDFIQSDDVKKKLTSWVNYIEVLGTDMELKDLC